MKRVIWLIGLISLVSIISCESETLIVRDDLLGDWVNEHDKWDTLKFNPGNTMRYRNNNYIYEVLGDTIEIQYHGGDYIYVLPTKHNYWLDSKEGILTIDNLETIYPINGSFSETNFLQSVSDSSRSTANKFDTCF